MRIAQACEELDIRSIAVYSDADRTSPHVERADEAVDLGPAPARSSYLSSDAIIAAAKEVGADAGHLEYGFLSEDPSFAQACADAGLRLVEPPAKVIPHMGRKSAARARGGGCRRARRAWRRFARGSR